MEIQDGIVCEVGRELLSLILPEKESWRRIKASLKSLRRDFEENRNLQLPSVVFRDNFRLEPDQYQVICEGRIVAQGRLSCGPTKPNEEHPLNVGLYIAHLRTILLENLELWQHLEHPSPSRGIVQAP